MATTEMVVFCFDTLVSHFNQTPAPTPQFDGDQTFPLFVTWEIERRSQRSGTSKATELRGCIGTLAPTQLRKLRNFTFKSALQDHRFEPIGPEELPKLHCDVSLLVDYEDANSYDDWEIGVHGIIIEFDVDGRNYHATYLPDVAREQGWGHLEAITSLVRKAGYKRPVDSDLLANIRVTRYQSSKKHLSYAEYMEIKQTQEA